MSYLPGMKLEVENDDVCEEKDCSEKASLKIISEIDSFGYESFAMCAVHAAEYEKKKEEKENQKQLCEWCRKRKHGVVPFRDWEEGDGAPVCDVCSDCRLASHKSAAGIIKEEEDEDDVFDPEDIIEEDFEDEDFEDEDDDAYLDHSDEEAVAAFYRQLDEREAESKRVAALEVASAASLAQLVVGVDGAVGLDVINIETEVGQVRVLDRRGNALCSYETTQVATPLPVLVYKVWNDDKSAAYLTVDKKVAHGIKYYNREDPDHSITIPVEGWKFYYEWRRDNLSIEVLECFVTV